MKRVFFHLLPSVFFGIFESIICHSSAGILRDQFNGLDNSINNLVFNSRVLALCVLSDGDNIDIIIQGLKPFYRFARSNIGVQVEFFSQSQIKRSDRKGIVRCMVEDKIPIRYY